MVSLSIRLFTDEDVDPKLALILREHGYDAMSCHEAGRVNRGIPDHEQLTFATIAERTIFTFNVRDFVLLDQLWKTSGRHHAGILVSARINNIGELVRRVERHLNTHSLATQHDQLLWLP